MAIEEELRTQVERAAAGDLIPGAAVLVSSPSGEARAAAGPADRQTGDAMRGDERFRIGSITKTMVGCVVLSLVDEGLVELDEPVDHFVPAIGAGITVRQALTHTSGLFSYTDDPRMPLVRFAGEPMAPEQLIALALDHPLRFAPGEQFDYSNTNFIIAGLIAEHASGTAIGELLAARVFAPLELAGTDFSLSSAIAGRHARGYLDPADERLGGRSPAEVGVPADLDLTESNPAEAGASGGVVSTLADVATFMHAYLGGRLVSAAATEQITNAPSPTRSGIGVVQVDVDGGEAWAKGGEMPGFVTRATASPDGAVAAVAMINMSGPEAKLRVVELSERAYVAAR